MAPNPRNVRTPLQFRGPKGVSSLKGQTDKEMGCTLEVSSAGSGPTLCPLPSGCGPQFPYCTQQGNLGEPVCWLWGGGPVSPKFHRKPLARASQQVRRCGQPRFCSDWGPCLSCPQFSGHCLPGAWWGSR